MKKTLKQWYMIAYDIREPARLRKLHYYLKQQAVALQKSVFLLDTDHVGLKKVLSGIKERVSNRHDDVRLYPIWGPGAIWGAGRQAQAMQHLYSGSADKDTPKGIKSLLKKCLGRKRS